MAARYTERDSQSSLLCQHPRPWLRPLFPARDYITGDSFLVGYCYRCHLYVTAPPPPPSDTQRYYPPAYYGQGRGRRFNPLVEWLFHWLYEYRVRHIEGVQSPGKVLDIGCGRGLLLSHLRERGWDTYGTELSDESAAYARSVLGLRVYTQPLDQIGFRDGEFDMVILWHVLEHIADPRGLLAEVSTLLRPGGTLLIAVPNFASWEAGWSGQHWFHLDVPRHLTHFTRPTLRRALDAAGMDIHSANFFSSEYDFYSFVQSAENKLGLPPNLLYDLLRSPAARLLHPDSGKRTTLQRALALLLAVPLSLASLVYAPVSAALGRGATMAIFAVKRQPPD